jgi:hypothetical protein
VTPGRGEPVDAHKEVSSDVATEPQAKGCSVAWVVRRQGRLYVPPVSRDRSNMVPVELLSERVLPT